MEKYFSEVIKEEYKDWTDGHIIFLSGYTGSGKSTLVLEGIVEYAAREGKRILYLVNRSILKKQIEKKINTEIKSKLRRAVPKIPWENIDNVIEIKLYQDIEKRCLHNFENIDRERKDYNYIVADECHYFLEDSTFNTYTQLSYEWILKGRKNTVLIFMSATIEGIKDFIIKDLKIPDYQIDYDKKEKIGAQATYEHRYYNDVVRNYILDTDYSFVNLQLLKDTEEIVTHVKKSKSDKWLIFVDSIDKGKEIQVLLSKEKVDSVFIDAESKRKKELAEVVGEIITEEKYNEQVLIATSVLDNGVSIKDYTVRKVIIMATVREEFIQMLGRKRLGCDEDEQLDVYILQRSKEEFQTRLSYVERQQRYINTFPKDSEKVLIGILESELNYKFMKNVCFVREGKVELSKLATEQYDRLLDYYQRIVNRFKKEGGTAFLREQGEWLDKKNMDEKIENLMQTIPEKIAKIIEKYVGRDLNEDDNMELREYIRKDIKKYLEGLPNSQKEEAKTDIDHLRKPSKCITGKCSESKFSDDRFNRYMKYLGLNYRMEKVKKGIWKIEKVNGEMEQTN